VLWKLQEIKIQPDVIFNINGFTITNTLIGTWLSIIVLVVLFYFGTRRRDLIPSGLQNALEWIVEYLLSLVQSVAGKDKGRKFFPLVATFFIFILFCNLLDVFPGVETFGWINLTALSAAHLPPPTSIFLFGDYSNKIAPWIRPGTSDLNLTLAMALVSVITTQAFGFYALGWKEQLGKYFNFRALFKFNFQGFIEFFVGILEVVTELSRILSFSFRLFGNVFAGGAVLAVFAFILPFAADIVFIPFELFIAFVQALIFSLLTLVFLEIATPSYKEVEGETEEEARKQVARSETEAEEKEAVRIG
jgi:F-type H+-transporting ATPase subunit a